MSRVLMYSTASCPFCRSAERLFERKGVLDLERVRVDLSPERRAEMVRKSGRGTVPQIWINGIHVGGCDDLYALEDTGELDRLLAQAAGAPQTAG